MERGGRKVAEIAMAEYGRKRGLQILSTLLTH